MEKSSLSPLGPDSQEVFRRVEESLTPGPVRDLWWSLRGELREAGPDGVRTYFDAEFRRRAELVRQAVIQLRTRLQEME